MGLPERWSEEGNEEEPPLCEPLAYILFFSACVPSKKDTDGWCGLVVENIDWALIICKAM